MRDELVRDEPVEDELAPGDLVRIGPRVARLGSFPLARGLGSRVKVRPAVVVSTSRSGLTVRPIHRKGSPVDIEGLGRTLHGWREAGLRKRSVVSYLRLRVRPADVSRPIGRLADVDRDRLLAS
jgi:hypothetical protein